MSEHHAVTELIPWYVNGSLNEAEMATVEAHLEACADCRRAVSTDVADARRLHSSIDEARINALTTRRAREFEVLRRQLGRVTPQRRPSAPHRWVPALAALLVIGAVLPAVWLAPAPVVYQLRTTQVSGEMPVLQLVFRDGTSSEDIDLLIRTSGTLIDHPSSGGVYRVALAVDDPQALLARMRAHPLVRWAEIEL